MDSREKILEVARDIFQKKGKSGTRMQEIADAAGVNKALLHYYFKNKDGLFKEVFVDLIRKMLLPLKQQMFQKNLPLEDRIQNFVDGYINSLKENPLLLTFILGELSMNNMPFVPPPEIGEGIIQLGVELKEDEEFKHIDPFQLATTIIGSCVFPFIARPMLIGLGLEKSTTFEEFLEERKKILPQIILSGIKIK
ncbi:TetR/AcrR family transcriptional regulator [Flammeovirga sp. EKP202]|uniref:TetR/AcrR family transcriptional regulator n=1 Tax=Flammeovirga sp. EKP202 TaxID=2770592 RepID=UPI00165FAEA3|nr:TetR/AcrR family transcriptional regulator [Flammeovirga sp. EKP202]MBD0405042.1 TetR/AcrR family transcriptional regulator [Flammeovirga sp. EKP202]